MKILHLYANHKWTGPAELALQTVRGLVAQGRDASLAIAGFVHAGMEHAIAARVREAGIPSREGLYLRRHFHIPSFRRDAKVLARWIDDGLVDLVHAHQPGDHLVAALALGRAKRRVPVVRSLWDGVAPRRSVRTYLAFRKTAALTVPVDGVADPLARRFAIDASWIRCVPGPIDAAFTTTGSVDAARARDALHRELGLAAGAKTVGITARIQVRRRWEVLWELVDELPRDVSLCVLGRPDEGVFEDVCAAPLRARGLTDRVHFLGYRSGEAYRSALAAFHAFVFLVPGSDATCRALREAMALGLPCVTSDLGLLPCLVDDGTTGFVCPLTAGALAQALTPVLESGALAAEIGGSARDFARRSWTAENAAAALGRLYDDLAQGVGGSVS